MTDNFWEIPSVLKHSWGQARQLVMPETIGMSFICLHIDINAMLATLRYPVWPPAAPFRECESSVASDLPALWRYGASHPQSMKKKSSLMWEKSLGRAGVRGMSRVYERRHPVLLEMPQCKPTSSQGWKTPHKICILLEHQLDTQRYSGKSHIAPDPCV